MRTIAQAITDLATKAKGSQAVPRGRRITDALDALADAMLRRRRGRDAGRYQLHAAGTNGR